MLPTEAKERKDVPIATGVIDYFPDAIAAIAALSRIGNEQHNPGKPLHWDRSKSGDESDALMRHFVERGTEDTDGVLHTTKVAWRALALLQKEIERGNTGSGQVTEQHTLDLECTGNDFHVLSARLLKHRERDPTINDTCERYRFGDCAVIFDGSGDGK